MTLPGRRVAALGFFDGVHVAHRRLISEAVTRAGAEGLEACVFTFTAENRMLKPGTPRIYTTEEKLAVFSSLGVGRTVLADFSDVASVEAETFVREILVGELGVRHAVCGYNFRFGRSAVGDADLLFRLMVAAGGTCTVMPPMTEGGVPVSATEIRAYIGAGDMKTAARLLGAPYRVSGRVEHGRGVGHTLGIPTVNLSFPEGICLPRAGVYRSAADVGGVLCDAVTNVGTCPTFGTRPMHAESYLVGYNGSLYGNKIRIFLLEHLRDERVFPDEKTLKKQIELDTNETIRRNAEERDKGEWQWQGNGQN